MSLQNREYLPHRRQRPLSDNTHEFKIIEHSSHPSSTPHNLRNSYKVMAAVVGLFSGLATVGMGATVLPWSVSEAQPRVAGIQTTQPYVVTDTQKLPTEDTSDVTCWNKVDVVDNRLYWEDSCRGRVSEGCSSVQVSLSPQEERTYRLWYVTDQVLSPLCNASSNDIPNRLPTRNPF